MFEEGYFQPALFYWRVNKKYNDFQSPKGTELLFGSGVKHPKLRQQILAILRGDSRGSTIILATATYTDEVGKSQGGVTLPLTVGYNGTTDLTRDKAKTRGGESVLFRPQGYHSNKVAV